MLVRNAGGVAISIDTSGILAYSKALAEIVNAVEKTPPEIMTAVHKRIDKSLDRWMERAYEANPRGLWHVYEPGDPRGRGEKLFYTALENFNQNKNQAFIDLQVKFRENTKAYERPDPSKDPMDPRNPMPEVFRWQAYVLEFMEANDIRPKFSDTLVWWGELRDEDGVPTGEKGWIYSAAQTTTSNPETHGQFTEEFLEFKATELMRFIPAIERGYIDGVTTLFNTRYRKAILEFARSGRTAMDMTAGLTGSGNFIFFEGDAGGQSGRFRVEQILSGDYTYEDGEILAYSIIRELQRDGEL